MKTGMIIKFMRNLQGIDQKQLAEEFGVTPTYISLIENEKKQPSVGFLKQVSKKFDIPLPLLLIDDSNTAEESQIYKSLQRLLADLISSKMVQHKPQ